MSQVEPAAPDGAGASSSEVRTAARGRVAPSVSDAVVDLLDGQRADPRVPQLVVLVPLVLEAVLRLLAAGPLDAWTAYAGVVVAVATALAWLVGDRVLASRWTVLVPVLDMVAIGLLRLSPGTAVGVAVVFPAMWLGLQFGRRGVLLVTAVVLGAFVLPTFAQLGTTAEAFSKISQMTLMAIVAALVVCVTAELWAEQMAARRATTRRLELAVAGLTEQRRLTRTIVHGVDVGLVAIDPDGAYDFTNPRLEEFLALAFPAGHRGWAGQTGFVFGPDGRTLLGAEDMPSVRALRGETFRDELVWVGRDPVARRALAVSATPYDRSDGTPGGAVLSYHDITELVLASRIKEEFVASVSHELRTPLTSIIGYLDVVLDDVADLPDDAHHYLGTVQRNAHRLHRLVDDLLSSALQSVATVIEVEPVRVDELLARSLRDVSSAADAAGVRVRSETPEAAEVLAGGGTCVEGDPDRLAQVLDNLVSNAVKYTGSGGEVVGSVLLDGDEVVVRVRDTGRGIAAHELESIFGTFVRSTSVVGEALPGVGLGLSIAKKIVDAHGGSVSVTSELGRGSCFEVRLPALLSAVGAGAA